PYRPELDQPHGVVHGGAIATLIDTVVVPAVGAAYEPGWEYATVTMDVQYLAAVVREDAVAEGWVAQRGRSLVFCRADVTTARGRRAGGHWRAALPGAPPSRLVRRLARLGAAPLRPPQPSRPGGTRMDFEFSEEQKQFLAEVEAFLDEHQDPEVMDPTRENMAQ